MSSWKQEVIGGKNEVYEARQPSSSPSQRLTLPPSSSVSRTHRKTSFYRGPVCRLGNEKLSEAKNEVYDSPSLRLPPFVSRTHHKTSFYRGSVCRLGNKRLSGAGVPPREKKKLSLERMTCLADKTNHPVERLSLNRSQCGSCSTKYDTSAGT